MTSAGFLRRIREKTILWSDLIARCLNDRYMQYPYWPGLTAGELRNYLKRDEINLRLMFGDDESLTEQERQDAYQCVVDFAKTYPKQQCIMVVRPASYRPGRFETLRFDLLIMQRLERRRIRHFLQARPQEDKWAPKLLDRLDQSSLFDLAGVPWFLLKLISQAKAGNYPQSRTQVLELIVQDAIENVVQEMTAQEKGQFVGRQSSQGLWIQIEQILYTLAWQMQSTLSATLPLADAFAIMKRTRGDREYSLEQLYEALVRLKLLAPNGNDAIRFAYQGIQAYCCARAIVQQPDPDHIVDNIVASMGRLTRLRWWEETLVFVCGLRAREQHPSDQFFEFLEAILFGVNLLETEQAFLAARCFSESMNQTLSPADNSRLGDIVIGAVTWRLDSRFEPRSSQRREAALLLGQVAYPLQVEHLVRLAYGKSRQDRRGEQDFDHSNVRMAAMVSFLRLPPKKRRRFINKIDKEGVLAKLLDAWTTGNVHALVKKWLCQPENISAQGVAALVLGDLYMRLALVAGKERDAGRALHALVKLLLTDGNHEATLWAVAYSLSMIDLPTVVGALVVEQGSAPRKKAAGPAITAGEFDAFIRMWTARHPGRTGDHRR